MKVKRFNFLSLVKKLSKLFDSNIFNLSFIIIITLLIFRPLFSDGYPGWADNSTPPVLNMEKFNDISNFTYAEHQHGLIYNSNVILMNFLPNKIALVLQRVTPDEKLLAISWLILPYLTLNIFIYLSFGNIFSKKSLCFLLTIFYIFSPLNFSTIAYGWDFTSYSIAFGTLFLSNFVKYLENPKLKRVFIMSILSTMGFLNIANFYAFLIGALMCFFVFVLVNKLTFKEIYKRYNGALLLLFLMLLINSYWILPSFFMGREVSNNFYLSDIYPTSILTSINTFNFYTSFALFNEYKDVFKFFISPSFGILNIFFMLLIFNHVVKSNDKSLRIFLSLYLLFFGLSLGKNFSLLYRIFHLLPGSYIIRSPQLKFFPLLFFFLSLMIGLIISKYKSKIVISFTILMICLGIYGFSKGQLFSYWNNTNLPDDYEDVISELSTSDNKYKTIAEFPKIWGATKISWKNDRYYTPAINAILYNPIITYNNWNTSVVPKFISLAYEDEDSDVAEILGGGGVRYILAHRDYKDFPLNYDFTNLPHISTVVVGKNVSLFKVEDSFYKPLFYSDEQNLEYERINPVMHIVKVKPGERLTFNRQHDVSLKLYDEEDIRNAGYCNCNFSIGNLNFCDILLLKVKPLPKQPSDNDYKNNWITPTDSSGSYVVYYEPQIYFYIGLIISFVAFILHILYLLLARDSDKNKRMVLN